MDTYFLFETQFRPNQPSGDDKGLSVPHTGLCQFALCDGSVRAISENIDASLYNALGTRSEGEVTGVILTPFGPTAKISVEVR
ncbi:MAG: DUF1559 domain-containing protein [Fuerstiella sp.]|nr:DUF1559 domain-containing protein [Fuerstiella sp.]MCP4853941.1 DUF1559 domain-containing protein [Fuerstiella sp.]